MTNTTDLPYKNPNLPAEERIADLLGRMTLEEKVGQMMQLDARSGDLDDLIVNKHVGSILHTSPADLPRAVETVNTKTRLGIPLIIGDDCIHGYSFWPGSTIFPSQLGMATSFDTAKVQAAGRATAEEVSTTGVHWTFSPVLCIARDTRWGRVDETFGEDPYLIGEMASAIVKGYQAAPRPASRSPRMRFWPAPSISPAIPKRRAAATLPKRTCPTASWNRGSCRRSNAWRRRVAARSCSATNPSTACRSPSTSGCCPTSCAATGTTRHADHRLGQRRPFRVGAEGQGRLRARRRGRGQGRQRPDHDHAEVYEGAIEAVRTGLLDESLIDEAVSRILALKFRLGLFEDPRLPDQERIKTVIGSKAHQELNLQIARESVALLKNDGALPFSAAAASASPWWGRLPMTRRSSWAIGPAIPVRSIGCRMANRVR